MLYWGSQYWNFFCCAVIFDSWASDDWCTIILVLSGSTTCLFSFFSLCILATIFDDGSTPPGGHTLQHPRAQQKREGHEGAQGPGRWRDDDFWAVVVQGFVPRREGVSIPGGESRGRRLSQEG